MSKRTTSTKRRARAAIAWPGILITPSDDGPGYVVNDNGKVTTHPTLDAAVEYLARGERK